MEKISEHVSYKEATYSFYGEEAGLENIPNAEQLENIKATAENIHEKARSGLGDRPIQINSFFRSPAVNALPKIGGAKNSKHTLGEAEDMEFHGTGGNAALFNYIKENLEFDELIWEFGNADQPAWVHCSYSRSKNRHKIMQSIKGKKGTEYKTIS